MAQMSSEVSILKALIRGKEKMKRGEMKWDERNEKRRKY